MVMKLQILKLMKMIFTIKGEAPVRFGYFIACVLLSIPSLSYAGEWTRLSPTTIAFTGEIEKDELSKFKELYKATDSTLIVDSGGGNMAAALEIGKVLIQNQNLNVVVRDICASSCANYLFLAGHTKTIDHGIVGFHGNWKAMVESDNFKKEGMTIEPVRRATLLAYHKQKVIEETEFLSRAGVAQELFDKTQKENDDGRYDVYLPGPRVFAKYGIKNVTGLQDKDFVNRRPDVKVLYDDDLVEKLEAPAAAPVGQSSRALVR